MATRATIPERRLPKSVRDYLAEIASRGGKARAKKYDKETLRRWAAPGPKVRNGERNVQAKPWNLRESARFRPVVDTLCRRYWANSAREGGEFKIKLTPLLTPRTWLLLKVGTKLGTVESRGPEVAPRQSTLSSPPLACKRKA